MLEEAGTVKEIGDRKKRPPSLHQNLRQDPIQLSFQTMKVNRWHFLFLENNWIKKLLLMWFKGAKIHPKLATEFRTAVHTMLTLRDKNESGKETWTLPLWFQRATGAGQCVAGKSLTKGSKRPQCATVKVNPTLQWSPEMLEIPEPRRAAHKEQNQPKRKIYFANSKVWGQSHLITLKLKS